MTQSPLPTAQAFKSRMLTIVSVTSAGTIAMISGYLVLLMRLPHEQWVGFAQIVSGFFAVLLPLAAWTSNRVNRELVAHLERAEKGTADEASLHAAFRNLSRMPRTQFLTGIVWWFAGGALVGGAMAFRYAAFGAFPFAVMVLAAGSGGFISSTFLFFTYKRQFRDLHDGLADRIRDPAVREHLTAEVPIRSKLLVAVSGVTFVTVTFAMCLSYVASSRQLETRTLELQDRLLGDLAEAVGGLDPAARRVALAEAEERARSLGIAERLVLMTAAGEIVIGPSDGLLPTERSSVEAESARGDSLGFDSPNVFSWRRLPRDGAVLAAVTPWRSLSADEGSIVGFFALMLVVSAGITFALSRFLAADLGETALRIKQEVERVASGDLSEGRILESEDELGALARSFERMTDSMRAIVGSVTGAADQVGATAGDIAALAHGVASGASTQGEGVKQAAALMEGIHGQVEGVAASAQELNLLVEESSSSILEMGAAGDELNDTAGVLSSKVDEVSSSIEQMVRSVKQIATSTESLSEAAGETSASMEEMASAMRQVDVTAEETGRLSRHVVDSAEQGHAKVRQTIQGMESIRSATETAERVIRGLGARAEEIGAILDVIDDVADETNLLALNAAIIAAQAGEHGRAFSVVADEIKELADRVIASTKEIGGLIRSVQEESANAVGAIEQGSRSVASGVQLSMEAGDSLEEITRASRDAGMRIQEIVQAVREQTKAAGHVVDLMERVNHGVEAIQRATSEQDRGNEVVFRSSVAMREVATQLRGTTEEQARGGARIRESIDGVRDAVEAINRAIQVQSESNAELARFLEEVSARTASNEESARRMEGATTELRAQSEALHADVRRFRI